MNGIKWIFNKETRHGRGIRTGLQFVYALLTFVAGLIIIPGVSELLLENQLVTAASFATLVGVISYLQNLLEDLLKEW